ncbi:MAG: potassium channel family protein [Solirubrobacterales bacterium]
MKEMPGGRFDGRRLEALAERVSDYFGVVLALVLATYVLSSLLPEKGWSAVAISVTMSATSVFALIASASKPIWVRRAIGLAILAVLFHIIAAVTGDRGWQSAGSLIMIALLAVSMAKVLDTVVLAPEISVRTILGAVSVYTSLGLLFAFLYATVSRIQGGEHFFSGVAHPSGSDFIFFSYTTLTTVGYGDLVPGGQPGQMISGLEMLIGQIFLVTLVAGLVSGWRPGQGARQRRERREESSEETGTA